VKRSVGPGQLLLAAGHEADLGEVAVALNGLNKTCVNLALTLYLDRTVTVVPDPRWISCPRWARSTGPMSARNRHTQQRRRTGSNRISQINGPMKRGAST
jgi:hypothetical protein